MTDSQTPSVLSDEWLTTEETVSALGKAQRTVQEMAQKGLLAFKLERRKGNKPERMYSAADVQRYAAAKPPSDRAPRLRRRSPDELALTRVASPAVVPTPATDPAVVKIRTERWEMEREERERNVLRNKSWLTPRECSQLEGLPSRTIVELCESRKLIGIRCGRGWRISRVSLEGFKG